MKTWTYVPKSEWKDGPWKNEPDKAHWIDENTGLDCLIVRGPSGALCGYVGVPEDHKYYEVDYQEVPVDIHGGLTFSNKCANVEDTTKHVCHPIEDAANHPVWWLGFDCAHLYDITPNRDEYFIEYEATYKTFNYVKMETEYLARQLADV